MRQYIRLSKISTTKAEEDITEPVPIKKQNILTLYGTIVHTHIGSFITT